MKENKISKALMIIFAVLILAMGALLVLNFTGSKSFEIPAENHENLTEEEMQKTFQTDYGWTDLESHEFFWDADTKQIIINYYFADGAEEWQIESAMEYGLNSFVFKQFLQLSPQLYQMWFYEEEISEVVIQAFEKEKMVRQDIYGEIVDGIVHEESHFGK
ncbi:MAG: hypothetical protein IJ024_01470 [Lachnospiraceae bacterium]|nr:hypothetical protein [Lachnospiraceae bacterium]